MQVQSPASGASSSQETDRKQRASEDCTARGSEFSQLYYAQGSFSQTNGVKSGVCHFGGPEERWYSCERVFWWATSHATAHPPWNSTAPLQDPYPTYAAHTAPISPYPPLGAPALPPGPQPSPPLCYAICLTPCEAFTVAQMEGGRPITRS